jgi:tape measure domain-containing protein
MSDSSEFKLEFDASEAREAARAAADVEKLADSLDHVAKASAKVPSKTAIPSVVGGTGAQAAMNRLNASYTKFAPVSKTAAKALQFFGVSGAPLRKVTVDAAKTEQALGRLFSITKRRSGGGLKGSIKGTGAVIGSMWQRMGQPEGEGFGSGTRAKASDAVMGGLGMAATATAALAAAAAVPIGILATSMTSTALAAEQLKFGLDRITDGKGQQWWATSSEYAKKFGLDVNQVAQNLMGMKASGFSDELAQRMFQQFADMRSQGATSDNIGNALMGLKQLRAAGKATAEDLNQVTENLSLSKGLVWEQLAKQLGKTSAEAKKQQESGNVTSDQMIEAISAAIGIQTKSTAPGEAGSAAVNATTLGAWERLKATFSVASADALGGDALKPLRDGIVKFTTWLDGGGGAAMISSFGKLLGKVFEYAPTVIDKVIWLLDTAIPDAWDTFVGAFSNGANTAVWDVVIGFMRDMAGPDGEGASSMLNSIALVAGTTLGALSTLAGGIALVVEGIAGLVGWLGDTSGWEIFLFSLSTLMGPVGMAAFALGEAIVRGIGGAITGLGSSIGAALMGVVRSAISGAGSLLSSMPVVGGLFSGLGGNAADGMAQGISGGASDVAGAAASMGDAARGGVVDSLQIHSPSRVMDKLAYHTGSGFTNRLDAMAPWAAESGAAMGSAAAMGAAGSAISPSLAMGSAASMGMAGAVGSAGPAPTSVSGAASALGASAAGIGASTSQPAGGTATIEVNLNVTISGDSSAAEKGQQIGAAAVRAIEPDLAALLRRLNYSGAA